MKDPSPRTLLRPGETRWAELSDEKRKLLAPDPETPVEQLLRAAQELSHQAARLLGAVDRTGERRSSQP